MIRPARTHRATPPTAAVRDALAAPTGSLPGGTARRLPVGRRTPPRPAFSHVLVTQPAAGRWQCDECPQRGQGGHELLAHYNLTGHRLFTPKDEK